MGATASGMMNVDSFRQYVTKGRLPPLKSFSVEGFFKEYYFPTMIGDTKKLLEPTFSVAQITDHFTGDQENFLTLELNSCKDGMNERKPLNLMIVLDISSSMRNLFMSNQIGKKNDDRKSKIQVAVDCVRELIKLLKDDEKFGLVLMNNRSFLYQPMREKKKIDLENLGDKLRDIPTLVSSTTYLQGGLLKAYNILSDVIKEQTKEQMKTFSNRVVLLSDANIRHGLVDRVCKIMKQAAGKKKIYTTYISVGAEAHELEAKIGKIRGCNGFSTSSEKVFKKMLVTDFNYLVNPICFDVVMGLESKHFSIDKVYGAQTDIQKQQVSGELFRIDTVIASDKSEKGVKGACILVKLKENILFEKDKGIKKIVKTYLNFETLDGKKHQVSSVIDWDSKSSKKKEKNYFENKGVRKAVLLTQYHNILFESISGVYDQLSLNTDDGMASPNKDLQISKEMIDEMKKFKKIFIKEAEALDDISLIKKELDIIDSMIYAEVM